MTSPKVFIQVRDGAKKEIWSINGFWESYQNQAAPPGVFDAKTPNEEGHKKELTVSPLKMNFVGKILNV